MSYNNQLFKFAYFIKYDESIEYLAENLASPEQWNYSSTSHKNYPILKSYLEYTHSRLKQEQKIKYTSDNQFAAFNTGLVTPNLEDIYAFFEASTNPSSNSSPYFFKAFLKESDSRVLKYFSENIPEVANYFSDPSQLIFNPKLRLVINIDHIIEDNLNRFPKHLQAADPSELRRQITGATEEIKKKVRNNYKLAVPQFYNSKFQLLLPLCLTNGSPNPDLALVVSKLNNTTYTARTCLTLRMAYNNARLIVEPQSNWLKP
jgi:Domain of unknown function (DUF3825)